MKIVVPVKEVAVLDEEFELLEDRPGSTPTRSTGSSTSGTTSRWRRRSQLREAQGDGEVVVVSVGDEEAEEGLRACLAKGADRALRVWDDSLEGADPLTVARVLAAVAERESPGPRALRRAVERRGPGRDGRRAGRSPRVAARGCGEGARLRSPAPARRPVDRELEGGLTELLRVRCPRCSRSRPASTSRATRTCARSSRRRRSRSSCSASATSELDGRALEAAAGSRTRSVAAPRARAAVPRC